MSASPSTSAPFGSNEAPKLGRYELGRRLASGGAGAVYLARLSGMNDFERLYAVKCIHEHLRDEPGFAEMFLDEARLVARLSHPNVVQVYELAQDGDVLFMAMEYLHGESLATLLRNAGQHGLEIGYDLAAWIMAQVADGLHHAHQVKDKRGNPVGLVHRDVSPQNVFLTYDGHVKLIDFGIARAEGRVVKTQQGKIKGKLMYMAPEQALGTDVDHRADQFSLGATLYELATGARLFPGGEGIDVMRKVIAAEIPSPTALRPDFPKELESILLRTLERDRKRRYESCAVVARQLHLFAERDGEADLRERLAGLMSELCAESRASRELAIRELKQRGETESRREPPAVPRSDVNVAPTQVDTVADVTQLAATKIDHAPVVAPKAKARRLVLALAACALGLCVLLIWAGTRSLARTRAVPASVALDITLVPAVSATIRVAGEKYFASAAHLAVPRAEHALDVDVDADGYLPARVAVVPDRDRSIVVQLAPRPSAPLAVPTVSAAPEPVVSGARPLRPPRSATKPRPTSDVIDTNPF